ncbi:MAG TPA: ABC transporter ATP-binding protein, partial [Ktedonobacteraceae bacterium]|nr:ABC transporter ATP-binding protein [Ktedonobacteraceae bacterium]
HILAEVEALCDRVSIVRTGRVVESGTLAQLRHLTRTVVSAEVTTVPPELATLEGVYHLDIQGNSVRFSVDTNALGHALSLLTNAGLHNLTCQPPTLEELFLRHYETAEQSRQEVVR